jgi:hypothetical protein
MTLSARILLLVLTLVYSAGVFAQTNLPPVPPVKSPVDTFRELLNLSNAERTQRLTNYSESARARLLEKVREYKALDADERELRLHATELRWWLMSLMRQAPTDRTESLKLVPERLHRLVESRLQLWSMVPPDLQKEMLNNEDIAQKFVQLKGRTPAQWEALLKALSPDERKVLEMGMGRWSAMSVTERRQTCQRFDQYFELSPREREKILGTLSDAERVQMEHALASFAKLPREERAICVRSFEKFASMDLAERQQFLKNAARWEKMTPAERQTWRDLVKRVPDLPPMPPEFGLPPAPSALPRPPATPATNSGG